MQSTRSTIARTATGLTLLGLLASCGTEAPMPPGPGTPPPSTGSLTLTMATTGTAIDPDGYTVTLGSGQPLALGVNATLTLADLASGDWVVRVGGVANNCALGGDNPRNVFVPASGNAQLAFTVACTATTGSVVVNAATTGTAIDTDGYTVAVGTGQPVALPVNGALTITDVAAGDRLLQLGGVANNCSVTGGPSQTVGVPAGGSVNATFTVTCSATTGSLRVSAATTGTALDPDGYTVTVGTGAPQTLPINGTLTFADVAAGDVTVSLAGVANNCTLTGSATRTATVPAGGSASAAYAISCTATTGSVVVNTSTSGTQIDANGYLVAVGNGQAQGIGVNTTVTVANVAVGDREVQLGDVAANCTVTGGAQRSVTVPPGGSVTASYVVTCSAPPPPATPDVTGTVVAADGGSLAGLRFFLRTGQRTDSVDVAVGGTFALAAPGGIAGDSVELYVDAADRSNRRYHPAYVKVGNSFPQEFRAVLVPRQWSLGGSRAGTTVNISMDLAFKPSNGAGSESFYQQHYASGSSGWWADLAQVQWPASAFPIPLILDRPQSEVGIAASDSIAFWSAVDQLEADMGQDLFRPETLTNQTRGYNGTITGATTVTVVPPPRKLQLVSLYSEQNNEIFTAQVNASSASYFQNVDQIQADLLRVLGIGLTCAWPSSSPHNACAGSVRPTAPDLAYSGIRRRVQQLTQQYNAPHGLGAAFRGERVLILGLPPENRVN